MTACLMKLWIGAASRSSPTHHTNLPRCSSFTSAWNAFSAAAFRERMKRKNIDDKAVIDDSISALQSHKTPNNLLFYSIGQRGLFHWFYRLNSLYRSSLSTINLGAIADEYVKDINFLNKIGF